MKQRALSSLWRSLLLGADAKGEALVAIALEPHALREIRENLLKMRRKLAKHRFRTAITAITTIITTTH